MEWMRQTYAMSLTTLMIVYVPLFNSLESQYDAPASWETVMRISTCQQERYSRHKTCPCPLEMENCTFKNIIVCKVLCTCVLFFHQITRNLNFLREHKRYHGVLHSDSFFKATPQFQEFSNIWPRTGQWLADVRI